MSIEWDVIWLFIGAGIGLIICVIYEERKQKEEHEEGVNMHDEEEY